MSTTANRTTGLEVAGNGIFGRMTPGPRARLLAISRPMAFGAGGHVLEEGADTGFLGVVQRGRIALRLRIPERGERITFATIEPGELLGWSALVPPYRATAEAVATEATDVLAFDAIALRTLLHDDSELAAELLPIVLEAVAHRLGTGWHQLVDTFCARTFGPW